MKKAILSLVFAFILFFATIFFLINEREVSSRTPTKGIDSPESKELLRLGVDHEAIENYLRSGNTIQIGDFIYPITSGSTVRIVISCSHRLGGLENIKWDKSIYISDVSEDDRSLRTDQCTNVNMEFSDFSPNDYHQKISITNLFVHGGYSSTANCIGQGIDWFCREKKGFSHSRDKIDFFIISPEEQLLLDKASGSITSSINWKMIVLTTIMLVIISALALYGIYTLFSLKYSKR